MKNAWFWIVVLASMACSQEPLAQSQDSGPSKEEIVTLNQLNNDPETQEKLAGSNKPTIKVEMFHEETGERKLFDAEVNITPGESYVVKPTSPEQAVDHERFHFADDQFRKVPVTKDKVTIIEYWSADGMEHNRFWSQMREVEKMYAGRDDIQILSVNYDLVLAGRDQVETTREMIGNYTQPARIVYDFQDSLRGEMNVYGGNCYYLIDHRNQLTHLGRGDVPATQQLFDAIENALLFQKDAKKGPMSISNVRSIPDNE